jgi:Flp pilus assembly CpaF family ATPase
MKRNSNANRECLHTIAAWIGTTLNHGNPILENELPLDGSRFEGRIAPAVRERCLRYA